MPKEKIRNLIYSSGNTTSLLDDGLIKVINGLTSFEEVLRVIDIEDDLGDEQNELKNAIMGKKDVEPEEHIETQENQEIPNISSLNEQALETLNL